MTEGIEFYLKTPLGDVQLVTEFQIQPRRLLPLFLQTSIRPHFAQEIGKAGYDRASTAKAGENCRADFKCLFGTHCRQYTAQE
jgi:hypothetical protein